MRISDWSSDVCSSDLMVLNAAISALSHTVNASAGFATPPPGRPGAAGSAVIRRFSEGGDAPAPVADAARLFHTVPLSSRHRSCAVAQGGLRPLGRAVGAAVDLATSHGSPLAPFRAAATPST